MSTNEADVPRLSLMVLRLMDADLLLPEEGSALLAEIEAYAPARDETAREALLMRLAAIQSPILRRGYDMSLSIHAVGAEEGPAVWFLNTLAVIKATAAQTGGALSLIEQVAPVGSGSPYHVHRFEDESFYVMEGELEFISEGTRFVKGPGSYVFLPKNIPHGFRVVGTVPAHFLIQANPGGFEAFVTEAGEPATERALPEPSAPDVAKLIALAAKYQIEILGPLPD